MRETRIQFWKVKEKLQHLPSLIKTKKQPAFFACFKDWNSLEERGEEDWFFLLEVNILKWEGMDWYLVGRDPRKIVAK